MGNKTYSRKEFISTCLKAGAVFFEAMFMMSACSSGNHDQHKEKLTPKSCNDLSGVSKSEIKKRESLGFVTESTVSGSHCSNCKLYLPPAEEEACGGCLLFDGPVEPNGYCTQYESRT